MSSTKPNSAQSTNRKKNTAFQEKFKDRISVQNKDGTTTKLITGEVVATTTSSTHSTHNFANKNANFNPVVITDSSGSNHSSRMASASTVSKRNFIFDASPKNITQQQDNFFEPQPPPPKIYVQKQVDDEEDDDEQDDDEDDFIERAQAQAQRLQPQQPIQQHIIKPIHKKVVAAPFVKSPPTTSTTIVTTTTTTAAILPVPATAPHKLIITPKGAGVNEFKFATAVIEPPPPRTIAQQIQQQKNNKQKDGLSFSIDLDTDSLVEKPKNVPETNRKQETNIYSQNVPANNKTNAPNQPKPSTYSNIMTNKPNENPAPPPAVSKINNEPSSYSAMMMNPKPANQQQQQFSTGESAYLNNVVNDKNQRLKRKEQLSQNRTFSAGYESSSPNSNIDPNDTNQLSNNSNALVGNINLNIKNHHLNKLNRDTDDDMVSAHAVSESGAANLTPFSQKRKVNFRPYSQKEMVELINTQSKKMGGLGPDIHNEVLQKKRKIQEMMKEYAENVTKYNKENPHLTNVSVAETLLTEPKKSKEKSRRQIALEYSTKVPKPKIGHSPTDSNSNSNNSTFKGGSNSNLSDENATLIEGEPKQLSELEILELQHKQEKEWLKKEFKDKIGNFAE